MTRPILVAPDRPALSAMYDSALHNLLDINTVTGENRRYIRAGAGYRDPWTRDASLNVWGAASILEPDVAGQTLRMVCGVQEDGARIIAQDNQWWDQIIWVIAAWQHYLVTGDRDFLAESFQIGVDSLAVLNRDRYRPQFGLYTGGALMQDGISGYPQPPREPGNPSSFVLDHPASREIMCLSTNAVYVGAHRALAAMAQVLGADPAEFETAADRIARAINETMWMENSGRYGYFLHPSGELDTHEEAAGIALAVLCGVADKRQADRALSGTHRSPHGVVNVWPHFPENYSDERPGRHNAICWPMVMGLFGDAAARADRADVVGETLDHFAEFTAASGGRFFELYNASTGLIDGGWQTGRHWDSEPDQTWSATAYLRLIHTGVMGIQFRPAGLEFRPTKPAGIGPLTLQGLAYRNASLDITVHGSGNHIDQLTVDGREIQPDQSVHLPAEATGEHRIDIHCS